MINVLLYPWELRGFCVQSFFVLRETVALQSMRYCHFGARHLDGIRYKEMSSCRVTVNRLTCSFPAGCTRGRYTPYKLDSDDAEQLGICAGFKIVKDVANILAMELYVLVHRVIFGCSLVSDVLRKFSLQVRGQRIRVLYRQCR